MCGLGFTDVGRLRTFGTIGDIKSHTVSFRKGFEAVPLNRGKMDKYIRSIVLLNKTKPLAVVKPLYSTFCHFFLLVSLWKFFAVIFYSFTKKKHPAQTGLRVLLKVGTPPANRVKNSTKVL